MKKLSIDKTRGPWVKMANPVKPFYLFDPRPEDIDTTNIAWSLSMQCRFNGHLRDFYCVAQHSVIVSEIIESQTPFDNELIFRAFMHDAHEAYIGDIVHPLKKMLPQIQDIEDKIEMAICEKYDMEFELPPIIKDADYTALVTESRDLHPVEFLGDEWESYTPLDYKIVAVGQEEAYDMFMARFEELQYRMRYDENNIAITYEGK